MRVFLLLALLASGCGGSKRPAEEPAAASEGWVEREFGEGRVRYRVPPNWSCQRAPSGETVCVGTNENDLAKVSAGVPQGPPDEMYEKLKSTSPPEYEIRRIKIEGHDAIETRGGDAVVVVLFSDDHKYFFMLAWLQKGPFAPQCRQVLRSVTFGA